MAIVFLRSSAGFQVPEYRAGFSGGRLQCIDALAEPAAVHGRAMVRWVISCCRRAGRRDAASGES